MIKKLIFSIFFVFLSTQTSDTLALLSNTAILKNSSKVQNILHNHGFKKVFFTTKDHINICGLFLDQSKKYQNKLKGTIIFSAGFYPGTKEGMATFYAMMQDQPYNFLFFDARGHNESSGPLWSFTYLKQYGSSEYLDILSAIEYLNNYNKKHEINPSIILHGVCSGAFHNIKALYKMQRKQLDTKNIKGIIFDSGWSCVEEIVEPTIQAEIKHMLQDSYFYILQKPLTYLITKLYQWTLKKHHKNIESIQEATPAITCPCLFIHSTHDSYAPIKPVQLFAQTIPKATIWWDDSHSHATCHLKKQQQYNEILKKFLDQM